MSCKVILNILRKSPNILTRAYNIAIVFLWSITPITQGCLVCSEVVICNPGQSVFHIYEALYSLKAHENSAEIFVIPIKMSFEFCGHHS